MKIIKIDPDIEDLVKKFLKKRDEDYYTLVTLLKEERYEIIKKECHRIAGTSLSYGFDELADLARNMEDAAQNKEPDIIGNTLITYKKYLRTVRYECHEE